MIHSFKISLSIFLSYFKFLALSFIVFNLILCVISCSTKIYKMTKGADKRKRDTVGSQIQLIEQNLQLITHTDFNIGNQ